MSAIPIPQQETDDPEELIRRIGANGMAIPLPPMDAITPTPAQPQLVKPSGHAIPTGRVGGISGTIDPETNLYNTPPAHQAGVASLWSKAENIHNPALRVLGKIGAGAARALDVAGSIAAPGVAAAIPGSTLNAKLNAGEAARQEEGQAEIEGRKATTGHTQAATDAIPADTAYKKAQTEALKTPKSKEEDWSTVPNAQGPNGEIVQQEKNSGQIRYAPLEGATVKPAGEHSDPLDRQYADAIKSGDHETASRILKVKQDLAKAGQAPQRPPQTIVITPGGQVQAARPGMTLEPGTQTAAGYATMGRPTSSTMTMIEAAPGVIALTQRVRTLVDQQEKSLGPAASRWAEFMAGKVGAPNPEFTKLRTDVGLLTTKLMRMHVGARGGTDIMHHFQDLIDTSKQSPENLRAALEEIETYAREVQSERNANQGAQGGGGGESKATKEDPLGIR